MQLYLFNEKKAREAGLYNVYKWWAKEFKIDLNLPYEKSVTLFGSVGLKFPHRDNPTQVDMRIFDPFIVDEPLSNYL